MSEEKKAYKANWLVKYNKKTFNPNSEPLMLTKDEAVPLLALGAICEAEEASLESQDSNDELSQEQQLSAVVTAIGTMDLTNAENTIASGAPDAGKLTELVGFNVSASLRNDAWAQVQVNSEQD